MGYSFMALCLLSSTVVLTTACGDDEEELEYKENQPEDEGNNGPVNPAETLAEAVDLGLSVMWASHNVGAAKPEELGNYYAWGETSPKSEYNWSTYKYGSDDYNMTKYCTDSNYGTVDNKTVLEPSDDAATVNWGNGWRMPTEKEMQELLDKCTWTWTAKNSMNGYLVEGKNGNSIFLPASGSRANSSLRDRGSKGSYQTSSLFSSPECAVYLYFSSGSYRGEWNYRRVGRSVRPVRSSAQN